jgi:hypothetical protein
MLILRRFLDQDLGSTNIELHSPLQLALPIQLAAGHQNLEETTNSLGIARNSCKLMWAATIHKLTLRRCADGKLANFGPWIIQRASVMLRLLNQRTSRVRSLKAINAVRSLNLRISKGSKSPATFHSRT